MSVIFFSTKRFHAILFLIYLCIASGCEKPPDGMSLVPAGEFIKGSNSSVPDESPERKIFLKAFYMDTFEVTQDAYKTFVKETKHREPTDWIIVGYGDEIKDHPVTYVSFNDAAAYCVWLGKRLPTEEEWEKGARGIDGRTYPWGNEFTPERANTSLAGFVGTTKIGMYEGGKSPYGIFDMAGNVWEWTSSDYDGATKVVKGGSWGLTHRFARTFTRIGYKPETKINNLGFRCVKEQ